MSNNPRALSRPSMLCMGDSQMGDWTIAPPRNHRFKSPRSHQRGHNLAPLFRLKRLHRRSNINDTSGNNIIGELVRSKHSCWRVLFAAPVVPVALGNQMQVFPSA